MTQNESTNAESVLNNDYLTESPHLSVFADDLPAAVTCITVDGINVSLHIRDDSGVVIVDYPAGMCITDTAFASAVEEAHVAVCRLARHTGADVLHDEFDVLDADTAGGSE